MTARVPPPDHEFGFELRVCRWAERAWPPGGDTAGSDSGAGPDSVAVVARQLGTRRRRWDTVIVEADPEALRRRALFGAESLDSDLLHVVRNAPAEWAWYRDALPDPGYPWRYVREAVHRAADRGVVRTRRAGNRIEIERRWRYPDWVERVVAVENKPDLDASAADALQPQLERDVAYGLADEVWVATRATGRRIEPVLLETLPDAAGVLTLDFSAPEPDRVAWHPRRLAADSSGVRVLGRDERAVEFEYVPAAEKAATRLEIAERAYGRGWRSYAETMRPDCASFALRHAATRGADGNPPSADETADPPAPGTPARGGALVPYCRAKECEPTASECSGGCPSFAPEPPAWRQRGWPVEGGPGRAARDLLCRRRRRRRPGLPERPDDDQS